MALQFAHLLSRRVIEIGGPDATDFLQNLISNDVTKVEPYSAIFATLLSAQGKLQFDMIVLSDGAGGFLLDVEAARADELIKKLKLYRLRAKVTIESAEIAVVAHFATDEPIRGLDVDRSILFVFDPRQKQLALRLYGRLDAVRAALIDSDVSEASQDDYDRYRVSLGLPEGVAELGEEKLFLLEANGEELNGVDFKKGCYVGQELTARMKHKTELKKRLLPFRVSAPIEHGTHVTANDRELGTVIGGRFDVAFALVRLDRLAEADLAALRIGDAAATLLRPPYLPTL